MKKKELKAALDALKQIKLPKIEDKELKNAIIKDHFAMLGAYKKFEDDIQNCQTVHLEPYKEERAEVEALQQKLNSETEQEKKQAIINEIESHTDLIKAIGEFNEAVNKLAEEEVEITPLDHSKFMEAMDSQDFGLDVIESLFPMFNL